MAKGFRRWTAVTCTFIIVAVTAVVYHQPGVDLAKKGLEAWAQAEHLGRNVVVEQLQDVLPPPYKVPKKHATTDISATHHEIFSQSSKDGKYLRLDFGDYQATNPNILPHPQLEDTWIMVAQQQKSIVPNTVWFAELVCLATFQDDDVLRCIESPLTLPIAATASPHCTGTYEHFSWNIGPHDARVFYGPLSPFIIYGSNSAFACFGLWAQDFRRLVDWGRIEAEADYSPQQRQVFTYPTDLQRPPPVGVIEKNWFFFWDLEEQMYLHYDMFPRRVYARVEPDGAAGVDLSELTREADEVCMAKYLPVLPLENESIHQATNSLLVTMCKRGEVGCVLDKGNTFLMVIVQHKKFYDLHSVYEPYVVLFEAEAPFRLHAISEKPLWISGRGMEGETRPKGVQEGREWMQTEMLYVTSMSWKDKGMKYHGHADDVLLVGFGIEDETSAVIDVRAEHLLEGLQMC
jgi:hypothetical protein